MQFTFHIGAHCTDEDQLVKSLRKNQDVLAKQGVQVPDPARYRPVLRDVQGKLGGAPANQDAQDVMLEAMREDPAAERVVLSHESFLCVPEKALENGQIYPRAGEKSAWLRNLFPDDEVSFFIALRNPATWVPALHERLKNQPFDRFTAGIDPDMLLWSEVIRDIREANPDSPVTVWCNEDTPVIWPELMHEITATPTELSFRGGFDILSQIMAKEGVKRLRSYLGSHPPANEAQRRRVLAAFLDKYVLDDAIEEEIDLPGWTPELVEHLTGLYDEDVAEIAHIPGVKLLGL